MAKSGEVRTEDLTRVDRLGSRHTDAKLAVALGLTVGTALYLTGAAIRKKVDNFKESLVGIGLVFSPNEDMYGGNVATPRTLSVEETLAEYERTHGRETAA